MSSLERSRRILVTLLAVAASAPAHAAEPTRDQLLDAMKRASTFMVEKVSTNGGFVWSYLPDRSRRWGELEAFDSQIWVQPPGTPTMGHLFLDAYHATGDEFYYRAAERAADALIWGQHPSGGWNYLIDFGGDRSLKHWYATIGRNGWRLEEFQHYWGNATFDDAGTAEAAKLLLRLYVEKRDPTYKPALDKAIQFVLDSQYPIGAWPQRFPLQAEFSHHGKPDYTSYLTFNDDVAAENIDFLLMCYQALGEGRLLNPIIRGMNAFLVTQQGAPQPGWALQYTPDLKPVGARTYEPDALVTHTSARNIELLLRFYRLTGDSKFLARVPEAIDWLDSLTLPPGAAPAGRTHPTFIELGTNRPLYVHRDGSNVVNGRYYVDANPQNTLAHYSSFRAIDISGLRRLYAEAKAVAPADLAKSSPLSIGAGAQPLPRFVAVEPPGAATAEAAVSALNADGYWLAPLGYNSHPYRGDGSTSPVAGDFSQTHVGDDTDTSPYPDDAIKGISTAAFVRHMSALIRALDASTTAASSAGRAAAPLVWRLDNLSGLGGHALTVVGSPLVVDTKFGRAVEFDGIDDGLFLDMNPLAGLSRFTIEVIFAPLAGGPEEQRFLHFEEADTGNRALVELRTLTPATWCLDTYLKHGDAAHTLIDRSAVHDTGRWHVAALVFNGTTMTAYVDGRVQGSGAVAFQPLREGRTSIGVRQNRASWFKGRIREIRVVPDALTVEHLTQVTQ